MIINVSFYRFVAVDDPELLAEQLRTSCVQHNLLGKIVVAAEGMNGMLAGTAEQIDAWQRWLHQDPRFADMRLKPSPGTDAPYGKLVVRVKPEIVTMRVDGVDAVTKTGRLLPAETFRDWLRGGKSMHVIDVRNDYEVRLGSFRGAVDPRTEYFHQFPEWVAEHRDEIAGASDVVMFCTGGIRCEKATAWMLEQGFDNIWQLSGGVHTYFETIEDADRDWEGELFVFDERVAVDTNLEETPTRLCGTCGDPVRDGEACPVCASRTSA